MSFISSFFQKTAARFFTQDETAAIVEAVRRSELRTSGEIRVFVESKCRFVNPLHRAAELFFGYKMDLTADRNAVLVYIAMRDHQFAIFADEGIYREMGAEYWNAEAVKMMEAFKKESYADGIVSIVNDIGAVLQERFPYNEQTDKNELPDDILFGK